VKANDPDVTAMSINVANCFIDEISNEGVPYPIYRWHPVVRGGYAQKIVITCPLPIAAVERSRRGSDNDLTAFRVYYYRDRPVALETSLIVQIWRSRILANGINQRYLVCEWNSDNEPLDSANYVVTATKPCVHDVLGKSFYWVRVQIMATLASKPHSAIGFIGLDFPGLESAALATVVGEQRLLPLPGSARQDISWLARVRLRMPPRR
jgi:hypothetical protein